MAELLKNLASPSWWITVVFVGIAINLISQAIPGLLKNVNERYRIRSQEEKQRIETAIQKASESDEELQDMKFIYSLHHQRYILSIIVLSLTFLNTLSSSATYSPVNLLGSAFLAVFSMALYLSARRMHSRTFTILKTARINRGLTDKVKGD